MGMAMMASQIGLMRAQADNIRADTEEKKSGQYLKSVINGSCFYLACQFNAIC